MPVKLKIIKGPMKGHSFEITKNTVFVGRSSKNDIQIKDATISRKQVKLFFIGNKLFVEDLKSTNGTKLNGKRIQPGEGIEVSDSDILTMGDTVVQLTGLQNGPVPLPRGSTSLDSSSTTQNDKQAKAERRNISRNMQFIVELGEILKGKFSIHELCEKVVDFLLQNLPRIDRATIMLSDPETLAITTVFSRTRSGQNGTVSPYSRQVVEKTLRTGKSVRMSNTRYESDEQLSETIEGLKIKSLMCVPMMCNNRIRGAIYVDSLTRPYAFRKEDLMLLNGLSGPVAVAIENVLATNNTL